MSDEMSKNVADQPVVIRTDHGFAVMIRGEMLPVEIGFMRVSEVAGLEKSLRAAYEAGRSSSADKLQLLASALKKVLPPALLQELIDHCDPFAAFMREMQAESSSSVTREEALQGKCAVCRGPMSPCGHSEVYGYWKTWTSENPLNREKDGCYLCDRIASPHAPQEKP